MNVETLVIFGIVLGAAILHLKTRHMPIHQPVYDPTVRQPENRVLQIAVIATAIVWALANIGPAIVDLLSRWHL